MPPLAASPEIIAPLRLGYGARARGPGGTESADRLRRGGLAAWLDWQLKPDDRADGECARRLAAVRLPIKYPAGPDHPGVDEARGLVTLDRPIEALWTVAVDNKAPGPERGRPRIELAAAQVTRAIWSVWGVRELMVDFWHTHFTVFGNDPRIAAALPSYDRDVIRRLWAGNFRVLLEAVATSAAMLVYLNNRSSRAGAANENYGRELFELHTLGRDAYLNALYNRWKDVPGAAQGRPQGYIDQDVYEAARAFTGWSVEDGQGLGGDRKLPQSGHFTYQESWHDGYQKRVLATDFDPFQPPMADGRKVLDLVAAHPATARHLCIKLCRRLACDAPSEKLVGAAVETWTKARNQPDQIAQVIRTIVLSPEFLQPARPRLKRPLELVASFVRATEVDVTVTEHLLGALDASGQHLFTYPTPDGLPDDDNHWLGTNALRERVALVLGLADNAFGAGGFDPAWTPPHLPADLAAAQWLDRLMPGRLTPEERARTARAIATGLGFTPGTPIGYAGKDAGIIARRLPAYAALAAPFQYR
ncbi:MAG TPA: DUF1800 domain-containing protein [Candidatus Sulfotelmatobacter sp.]|nr:DUF1800 domain-containing protein [Candidatus Sulfotelmatobacter sp.]